MKRLGNVWDAITDKDNLRLAFQKAAKGRRKYAVVRRVEKKLDKFIDRLHDMLVSGNYKTGRYKSKIVYEPKRRTIHSLPFFPDRIVHHAILNVLSSYWDSLFIHDSYACRKGKGQHSGSLRCMRAVRRNKFVLKCDISKFYHSIPHDRLKAVVRKKLKDKRVLALLDEIIDSSSTCDVLPEGRGIPIGNLVSQWLGNLYLNELDTLIKHKYHVKDYIRYCDDFILFSNDKAELQRLAWVVKTFCNDVLDLRLSKCELFPISHGVDYLGYRHFRGYILLRKSTAKRVKRRISNIVRSINAGYMNLDKFLGQVDSTLGWLKWANTHNLHMAIRVRELREYLCEYKRSNPVQ